MADASAINPTAASTPAGGAGGIRVRTADLLDNEFRYYSKLIQELILMLSKPEDREAVPAWVHKLSGVGYNVTPLRDKRNRFMLMLCMCLVMDSVEGPFARTPPAGILPNIDKIDVPAFIQFDYELDQTWEEQLAAIKELEAAQAQEGADPKPKMRCPIHRKVCPTEQYTQKKIGEILDKQFRFLLYLTKPYAAILYRSSDRLRAAKWIQALCFIDQTFCTVAKGIRNDYMMVLAGHIANQELVGPFEDYPLEKLVPIGDLAKIRTEKKPITDPTHPRTTEFFMDLPQPDEGAFAFIAVTGDLYQPKFR